MTWEALSKLPVNLIVHLLLFNEIQTSIVKKLLFFYTQGMSFVGDDFECVGLQTQGACLFLTSLINPYKCFGQPHGLTFRLGPKKIHAICHITIYNGFVPCSILQL